MNFESIDPDQLDLSNETELTPQKRKEMKQKLLDLIQEGHNLIKSTEQKYEEDELNRMIEIEKRKFVKKTAPVIKIHSIEKVSLPITTSSSVNFPISKNTSIKQLKTISGISLQKKSSSNNLNKEIPIKGKLPTKTNNKLSTPSSSNSLNKEIPNKRKLIEMPKKTIIKLPTTSSLNNLNKEISVKVTAINKLKTNPQFRVILPKTPINKSSTPPASNQNKKIPVKWKLIETNKINKNTTVNTLKISLPKKSSTPNSDDIQKIIKKFLLPQNLCKIKSSLASIKPSVTPKNTIKIQSNLKNHKPHVKKLPTKIIESPPPPFEEVFIKMETYEDMEVIEWLDDENLEQLNSVENNSSNQSKSCEVIAIDNDESLDSDEMSEILSKLN